MHKVQNEIHFAPKLPYMFNSNNSCCNNIVIHNNYYIDKELLQKQENENVTLE